MKSLLQAALMALAVPCFASPAAAWPYIDVTASEVLSVDPPRFRTTFVISIVGYQPGPYQFFSVFPSGAEPRPQLLDCTAPAGWRCGPDLPPEWGSLFFSWDDAADPPPPHTFSVVSDRPEPCVRFYFYDPVLARAARPTLNADYAVEACLALDAPVPTATTTWGHLKTTYR